jgi:hypothetical protein
MRIAIIALCVMAAGVGGCRREEPYYEPMKLGSASNVSLPVAAGQR